MCLPSKTNREETDNMKELMKDFYEWFDDKTKVIAAVLIVTLVAMWKMPTAVDLAPVYTGLFGIVTGYALGRLKAIKD